MTTSIRHPRRVLAPAERRERAALRKAQGGVTMIAEAVADAGDERYQAWVLVTVLDELRSLARSKGTPALIGEAINTEMQVAFPKKPGGEHAA